MSPPERLEKNLEALRLRAPEVFDRLIAPEKPAGRMEFLETPGGDLTAKWEGRYVHSPRNPWQEARQFIEKAGAARRITLLQGFGLGYHVRAFLERPEGVLWVLEADIPFFLDALSGADLRDILSHPRVVFLFRPRPEAIPSLLLEIPQENLEILKVRSIYEKDREYYESVDRAIMNFFSRKEVNKNTLKKFGRLWVRNLFHNLPLLPEVRGLYRLEGVLSGLPALILAAGPSLDEALPLLPELKKRFVLIALDTSYRASCRAAGDPDFLVVVDPQYWNTRHLDGANYRKVILISDSSTHPGVFRNPRGRPFFCRSHFPLGQFLEEETDVRGKVAGGGSVATFAWELGRTAGASEIYCAGLDLGFPGNQTHMKESYFERRSLWESRRLFPLETQSFLALHSAAPYRAPDNAGGMVLTDRRMDVYRRWFESQLARPGSPGTYNLSAGGVAIAGMKYRRPEELLAFPEVRAEIDRRLSPFKEDSGGGEFFLELVLPADRRGRFLRRLDELNSSLEELEKDCREGLILTDLLADVLAAQDDRRRGELIKKLDETDRRILAGGAGNIAGFLFQDLISEILAEDPPAGTSDRPAAEPDPPGGAAPGKTGAPREDPLEKSRRLYTRLLDSAAFHRELLDRALNG